MYASVRNPQHFRLIGSRVVWSAAGELLQLGPTPAAPGAGPGNSKALDLNNRGEVVGFVDERRPGGTDGYRWTIGR